MANQIQVFENKEFGRIEVLTIDGNPYFPATECARLLGYKDTTNAIKQHCKGVVKHHILTPGGKQEINFITEGNLYRLIIRSKLPAAERFEAWVCDVVLPTIRKHGAYITDDTLRRMREDSAFAEELLNRLNDERKKNESLLDFINGQAPKVRYYDAILQCKGPVLASVIAKDYGMTAIAFNKLLYKLGIQYKLGGTWLLYKDYMNNGFTVTKTHLIDGVVASIHTCWTQKGRMWLYDVLGMYNILPEAEKIIEAAAN